MAGLKSLAVLPLALLLAYQFYVAQLQRPLLVMGVFRKARSTAVEDGDFVVIEGTTHCEDLHHYEPSGELFASCEGEFGTRLDWFPPIENLNFTGQTLRGGIVVIDSKTQKARSLDLEGFDGSFVTHGIDVIPDPEAPEGNAVFIFAVNHPPNMEHYLPNGSINPAAPKARSVIEVFHHVIGSNTAQHVRTIWSPLITMPNDVFAVSPEEFFVTNDHYYRDGLMRMVEDLYADSRWTDTTYVRYDMSASTSDSDGVHASTALQGLHNNNGMAHGRTSDEVIVTECSSGVLNVGHATDSTINLKEKIPVNSTVDNPSYFSDPYASSSHDASGIMACGHARAINFFADKGKAEALEPVMVWKASPVGPAANETPAERTEMREEWETKLVFEDDGRRIRTCSAAVMVAIDPQEEGGRRRAWLYATGYWSRNMIAVKVDL